MNILYVYADNEAEWNCSQWRSINPSLAINRALTEHKSEAIAIQGFMERDKEAQRLAEWADVIVIERLVIANTIVRILEFMALGKIIICDVDDAYHYMPKSVNAYKFWHEGFISVPDEQGKPKEIKMGILPIEQLEWGMKYVHAVTSPSLKLVDDWKKYNSSTVLVPNYMPTSLYLPFKRIVSHTREEREKHFVIGWGGSWTHLESWKNSGIIEALKTICKKYPQVIIRIAGGDERLMPALGIPGRVYTSGWMPFEKWPAALADYDLGLIPLSGQYDDRRSWIKSLEYTLMGIPWIGSKCTPTEELAAYGTRVKNIPTAWVKAIEQVIEDYDTAKAQVDSGIEFALAQDIEKNVPNIINIYQSIINKVKEK